jgi:hypothetical protein
MQHFVIPEGIRILKEKLMVRSASVIPKFNPFAFNTNCNDDQGNGPNINIRSNYHTRVTRGDFLLYVGVINDPNDNTLAYASFCVRGEKIFF